MEAFLPKALFFNYPSVLKEVFFIIEKLKKALAVRYIVQTEKEIMKRELDSLCTKQARLEAEYTPHKKQGHEEKFSGISVEGNEENHGRLSGIFASAGNQTAAS